MDWLRGLIYKWGFRPQPGSILFSPSRHLAFLMKAHGWPAFFEGYDRARSIGAMTVNETRFGLGMRTDYRFNPYGIKIIDKYGDEIHMNPCEVRGCGKVDDQKAMVFKGTAWCSEKHRKVLAGELPEEEAFDYEELVITMLFEPFDWYRDGSNIYQWLMQGYDFYRWVPVNSYEVEGRRFPSGRQIHKPYEEDRYSITGWVESFADGGWRPLDPVAVQELVMESSKDLVLEPYRSGNWYVDKDGRHFLYRTAYDTTGLKVYGGWEEVPSTTTFDMTLRVYVS